MDFQELSLGQGVSFNQVFENVKGTLTLDVANGIGWQSAVDKISLGFGQYIRSIAWGDADGDGDLTSASGNGFGAPQIYLNSGHNLTFNLSDTFGLELDGVADLEGVLRGEIMTMTKIWILLSERRSMRMKMVNLGWMYKVVGKEISIIIGA